MRQFARFVVFWFLVYAGLITGVWGAFQIATENVPAFIAVYSLGTGVLIAGIDWLIDHGRSA